MISLTKALISAAVGGIDIVAEQVGKGQKVLGSATAEDVFRIGLCAGSLAASILDLEKKRGAEGYSDFLFYVSLPLTERSVYKMIKETMAAKEKAPATRAVSLQPVIVTTTPAAPAEEAEIY